MKKRIHTTLVALLALACSATGQSLTVQGIETKAGEQATLTASLSGATSMTALQFNLALPDGVTIAQGTPTLGTAANGHTLAVETLDNGDRLFVLYSMDLNTFRNGQLLSIPVTIGSNAKSGEGSLTTVRFATTEAVSNAGTDAKFNVTVQEPEPEGFSNSKLYTLTCKRGGLAINAEGTGLTVDNTRTDLPEADRRFAIITYNGAQYLYSPVNKQYLLFDGSFVSRLGTAITFDDTHADGTYKYMLSTKNENGETLYFNINGSGKIVIVSWDTPDDGNRWLIEPVANFDPTEALALAAKQTCTVTYEVKFDGQVVATATKEVTIGDALPATPASLTNSYMTLTKYGTHPSKVTQDVTVQYTATWNGPFQFSKNLASAKWYNMTIRSNYYVGKQESEPYYPKQNAGDLLKTKEYHWAFGGNPYHVKLYNRSTGFTETLAKDGDNAVMRAGDYAWDLLPNADGFVLRETGTSYNCINQFGGNSGPLKFWDSAGSTTDDGSTFRVEEAQPLYDAIETLSSKQPAVDDASLYNLSGQRINRLQRGVIIRRSNGKSEKVLVK